MINHSTYVPILKWKQGEYQALSELDENIKKYIVPLFEIPPIGYDHERQVEAKSIDEHIEHMGSRLKKKWGIGSCFIDLYKLKLDKNNQTEYVSKIFDLYNNEGCNVIPVLYLDSSDALIEEIKKIVFKDKRGLCLRLKFSILSERQDTINDQINSFLDKINLKKPNVDLIVDFEDAPNEPYFNYIISTLKTLKEINLWRSFIIAGGSFPEKPDKNYIKRLEWMLYNKCYAEFVDTYRLPAFGDYNINYREFQNYDMRIVKPAAKLKYTLDEMWYFDKGTAIRGRDSRGYGQFRDMCQKLIETPYYRGETFSSGDKYINDCAKGIAKTGNLSTWVKVSVNQHLTKVVHDLASLYGFSI